MKLLPPLPAPTGRGLSVLSVEPYGMKLVPDRWFKEKKLWAFSALGRAVWDETQYIKRKEGNHRNFQCSRSSRMG